MSSQNIADAIDITDEIEEVSLPPLSLPTNILTNQEILLGKPIAPIDRLKAMPSGEFEDMVLEWIAGYLKEHLKQYIKVRKSSGAGDRGRDVMAYVDITKGIWDNYQCKHYDHVLSPGDIWLELGKLCFYSFKRYFPIPRAYYLVSPRGIGPTLAGHLENPTELRDNLIDKWDSYCKASITKKAEIPLLGDLLTYVKAFDFSIVQTIEPLELLDQYRATHHYPQRFGGGLIKSRQRPAGPPSQVQVKETRYIEQLFEAYSNHLGSSIDKIDGLRSDLTDHFHRQRESFYWADALEQFSRDGSGIGVTAFTALKEEVYFSVVDVCNELYSDGYARLKATTKHAGLLPKSINPLAGVYQTQDVHGICHHLANEDKLKWVLKI